MAHRSATHEATGYSLAMLIFGSELRLPVDLLTGMPPGEGLSGDASSFAGCLDQRMEDVHLRFRAALKFSGEVMIR